MPVSAVFLKMDRVASIVVPEEMSTNHLQNTWGSNAFAVSDYRVGSVSDARPASVSRKIGARSIAALALQNY